MQLWIHADQEQEERISLMKKAPQSKKLEALMTRVLLATLLIVAPLTWAQTPGTNSVVPTLVNFSGILTDVNNKPLTTLTGVTFYLYWDSEGGPPLWVETQNVQPDKFGHYTVVLGSMASQGLPSNLFATGEARWLGVQAQGQAEQPRVMLLAVPYALKAGDAQTVGGLPASAFVLAAPSAAANSSSSSASSSNPGPGANIGGNGTAGYLAAWTDNNGDLGNSALFQKGTGASAKVGIGTTTPAATLDVKGTVLSRGALELPSAGTANASQGFNSQPVDLQSSSYNSGTSKAVSELFQWQSEPTGNDTNNPSGTLNLLFGANGATPTETGLTIDHTGLFTFAKGQTFPGAGTITGVTTASGSGLTGGGTSGTLNLSLTNSCTSGQILQWSGSKWVCTTVSGTGTITGVTAGTDLTGGGTSGNVTLNLDITKVPQLNSTNTFSGMQTITVNGGSEALNVTQQATSGQTYGILGTTFSTGNRSAGITGQSLAGSGIQFGVYGYIADNDGAGVFGANGNPLSQTGGKLSGTFGSGLWGDGSGGGFGALATTDNNYAVAAFNNSSVSTTIFAENQNTTGGGALAPALAGFSFAPTGIGVIGSYPVHSNTFSSYAGQYAYGVFGDAGPNPNIGVIGTADSGTGVLGVSTSSGTGVYGQSSTGSAVLGFSSSGNGVYGATDNSNSKTTRYGVWGDDASNTYSNVGIYGTSTAGTAVLGVSSVLAVVGSAPDNVATFSSTDSGYTQPFFAGGPGGEGCFITTDPGQINCMGGSASVVSLPDSRWVQLHAVESPERWFEDFGSGQLVNGTATVTLEPTFAQTVNTGMDYHVFPVPDGDCKGLYIAEKSSNGFVVSELGGGKSNIAFEYRIVAHRKNLENTRLLDVTEAHAQIVERVKRASDMAAHAPQRPAAMKLSEGRVPLATPPAGSMWHRDISSTQPAPGIISKVR